MDRHLCIAIPDVSSSDKSDIRTPLEWRTRLFLVFNIQTDGPVRRRIWITRGFVQINFYQIHLLLMRSHSIRVCVWRRRLKRNSSIRIARRTLRLLCCVDGQRWSCAWHLENTTRLCCRMHQMIFVFVYACGMCCCDVCVWLINQIDCIAWGQSSPIMTRRLYSGQLFHSKNK